MKLLGETSNRSYEQFLRPDERYWLGEAVYWVKFNSCGQFLKLKNFKTSNIKNLKSAKNVKSPGPPGLPRAQIWYARMPSCHYKVHAKFHQNPTQDIANDMQHKFWALKNHWLLFHGTVLVFLSFLYGERSCHVFREQFLTFWFPAQTLSRERDKASNFIGAGSQLKRIYSSYSLENSGK